jgi:glycosyltransferase involved in cell wall biosynthesis
MTITIEQAEASAMSGAGDTTHPPLVSIIVSFLNEERFLPEAIESVLAQTYHEWELLLVDDGSTDASSNSARACAAQHPEKVHYFAHENHQNRGLPASRNLGLKNARGKYIALLDADDVWLPQKLKDQVRILESHPEAAMVYGRSRYWRSWTGEATDMNLDCEPDLGMETNKSVTAPQMLLLSYPLGTAPTPCPSDILLRKTALECVGGFEEDFHGPLTMYEDQAFLAKLYLKETVFVADECWDKYRLHPDSCVSTVTGAGQYHLVRKYFFHWLETYLRKKGIKDKRIWRALKRNLRPYRDPLSHQVSVRGKEALQHLKRFFPASRFTSRSSSEGSQVTAPPVGKVRFGDLRTVTPISRWWGFDRGKPVDRHYIENFLGAHANDVRGHVLEVGDDSYTRRFGGDRVTMRDVLDVKEGNAAATLVADLASADHLSSDTFDCIILTQTLHLIYDTRTALRTLHRILKPDGVLLATFPGISQRDHQEWADSWYWGFTTRSAQRLLGEVFAADNVDIQSHGNVLAAISFLQGLATEELLAEELDHRDPDYELLITVRAVKR